MASTSDYSKSHNDLMKYFAKIIMIMLACCTFLGYIVIVYKKKELSYFCIALLALAVCLLTINLCSTFGICPTNCHLVNAKSDEEKCIFKPGIFVSGMFYSLMITCVSIILGTGISGGFNFPELKKTNSKKEIETPEVDETPVVIEPTIETI